MSRLTLYGMYEYDPTLFDGLVMPARFNHDDLVNVIIEKCGDLYPYYQVPSWLKNNMTVWARRMYHQFERMIDVLYEDYDPLENYNRFENSTDTPRETHTTTHSGSDTQSHTGTDTETHSGTDTETHSGTDTKQINTTLGSTTTQTTSRSGFDSSSYEPYEQVVTGTSGGDQSIETNAHGEVITDGHGHVINDQHGHIVTDQHGHIITEQNGGNHEFYLHAHGNIGVTTSQQMLLDELSAREYDIYNRISQMFEKEFLIQIY